MRTIGERTQQSNDTASNDEDDSHNRSVMMSPGIWKYSRTRQVAFWMKQSVRNVMLPDFKEAYTSSTRTASSGQKMTTSTSTPSLSDHCTESQRGSRHSLNDMDHDLDKDNEDVLDVYDNEMYCDNIDQAMLCLGQVPRLNTLICNHGECIDEDECLDEDSTVCHPYDWLLDGDPAMTVVTTIIENGGNHGLDKCSEDDDTREVYVDDSNREQAFEQVFAGLELEESSSSDENSHVNQSRAVVDGSSKNEIIHHGLQGYFTSSNVVRQEESFGNSKLQFVKGSDGQMENFGDVRKETFSDFKTQLDWIANWDPLPEFLPFEEPTTIEGIFVRNFQKEKDRRGNHDGASAMERVCCNLPSEYFDENHDAVLDILQSLPWKEFARNGDMDLDNHGSHQDTFLIETLSSLDELSNEVSNALLSQVKEKHSDIHEEMKRTQAIDTDVAIALSSLKQATNYLQRARGKDEKHGGSRGMALGGLYIIEDSEKRDSLRQLNEFLKSVEEMVAMEASIFEFVDNFSFSLVSNGHEITVLLDNCEKLKNRLLNEDSFQRLRCLDETRDRLSNVIEQLCHRVEEELYIFLFQRCKILCCDKEITNNWNQNIENDYAAMYDARVLLNANRIKHYSKNGSVDDTEEDESVNDVVVTWPSCIYSALCFEADRCLPRALLNPTPTDGETQHSSSEFDSNLLEIKKKLEEIQYFNQDAASIQSLTANLLTIKLEFEQLDYKVVGIFHALCSSLANILYVHHTLTEWHKDNKDTNTVAYGSGDSHSCGYAFDESQNPQQVRVDHADETITKEDYTKSTTSSNCSRSSASSQPCGGHDQDFSAIPQCISGPDSCDEDVDLAASRSSRKDANIFDELLSSKRDLWLHCKAVMVKFLNAVVSSQEKKEKENWSMTWLQDLESLYDLYRLSDQMLKLGREFLCENDANCASSLCSDSNMQCELKEVLTKVFLGFLRGAHVESMTEIGTMIANETWDLLPFSIVMAKENDYSLNIQSSIHSYVSDVRNSLCSMSTSKVNRKLCSNRFDKSITSYFTHGENPFMMCDDACEKTDISPECNFHIFDSQQSSMTNASKSCRQALYEKVQSYTSKSSDEIVLASKTALNGLARWTVKLQAIQTKLPLISNQVEGIICNLYDLYFLTVFRLCIGDGRSEAVILGNSKRSDHTFNERFPKDLPPPPSRTEKLRQKVLQRSDTSIFVSRYCDADINTPTSKDESVGMMQEFVFRGQASLSSMVSLDRIETWNVVHEDLHSNDEVLHSAKRMEKLIAASSSNLFVACLLEGCVLHLHPNLESPILTYLEQMLGAICGMHNTCLQMCSTRAIMSERVVSNIVSLGNVWSEAALMEHCNSYVDDLSDRYVKLWHHLSNSSLASIEKVLFEVWEHVVESGFLSLLEGFSKIFHCSTEGRALMSMDLATFAQNVTPRAIRERYEDIFGQNDNLLCPPYVAPRRGKQYVDTYIKVFYFPIEDIMKWIQENRTLYHLSHLLALVSIGAHNQLSPQHLTDLLARRDEVKRVVQST